MAGQRSIGSPKADQPGILNFMQTSTPVSSSPLSVEAGLKNNKRPRNSPESDQRKHLAMESNANPSHNNEENDNQAANLPPELKLLYVSLTKMMEKKMQPIKNDMKTLLKDRELLLEYVQKVQNLEHSTDQLNNRVVKIEQENQTLKQKLVKIEDKLLENNLIISGVDESKFEEEGPRHEKQDTVIAKVLPGETEKEKLEKARKLDIVSTAWLGKYNPIRGCPISVVFVKKQMQTMCTIAKTPRLRGLCGQGIKQYNQSRMKKTKTYSQSSQKTGRVQGHVQAERYRNNN